MSALKIGPPASGAKCKACGGVPALSLLANNQVVVDLCGHDGDRARDLLIYGVGAAINAQVFGKPVEWDAINRTSEPVAE